MFGITLEIAPISQLPQNTAMLYVNVLMSFMVLESTLVIKAIPVDGEDFGMFVDDSDGLSSDFISRFNAIVDLKCGSGRSQPDEGPHDVSHNSKHRWRLLEVNRELNQLYAVKRKLEHLKVCYMEVLWRLYSEFRIKHRFDDTSLPLSLGKQLNKRDRHRIVENIDGSFEVVDRDGPMAFFDTIKDESELFTRNILKGSDDDDTIAFERITRGSGPALTDNGYGSRIDAARNLAGNAMAARNLFGVYGPGRRKRQDEVVDNAYFDEEDSMADMKRGNGFLLDHGYGSRVHAGSRVAEYMANKNIFGVYGPGKR